MHYSLSIRQNKLYINLNYYNLVLPDKRFLNIIRVS